MVTYMEYTYRVLNGKMKPKKKKLNPGRWNPVNAGLMTQEQWEKLVKSYNNLKGRPDKDSK